MISFSRTVSAEELKDSVVKPVIVHVGERATTMLLGVVELGYTLNKDCALLPLSTYGSGPRINIANFSLVRVGEEFFQALSSRDGKLHLYLPSVVDDDDKVWKADKA